MSAYVMQKNIFKVSKDVLHCYWRKCFSTLDRSCCREARLLPKRRLCVGYFSSWYYLRWKVQFYWPQLSIFSKGFSIDTISIIWTFMKSQIKNNCCVIFNVKVHQQVKIPQTTLYLYFSIKPPKAVNYVQDIFLDRPHHCCNHYWNNDHYWNNYLLSQR